MKTFSCGLWIILCLASSYTATGLTEHKVHNIVLYPDKHSWCKTTGIKQIVAYPGCSSIEIDNNVCVGACFSYSIPRTMPSAPGEVITPYCDSCQPVDYEWKEVTLTCSDGSEEDDGETEMTKKVQVITNCTCTSCDKQYELKKNSDHDKHIGSKTDDIPELMSLMMETHHTRNQSPDSEEETTEDSNTEADPQVSDEKRVLNTERNIDRENLIEEDEEEDPKKVKQSEKSQGIEILHIGEHNSKKMNDLISTAKSEHQHYEIGPHHSLVLKPDEVQIQEIRQHHRKHEEEEEEKSPSLLENQFKIHDNEEYLDQIAVESIRKDVSDKILTLPDLIYKGKEGEENGVKMLDVSHHHLQPAVEGVQLSYFGKNHGREDKLDKSDH